MKSGRDLISEAKSRIKSIDLKEGMALHQQPGVVFLDVRDLQEVNLGKIPGAVHISKGNLETKVEGVIPRETQVVVYCASDNRSALAADTMRAMGYVNVSSMLGGFRGWAEAGGDIED